MTNAQILAERLAKAVEKTILCAERRKQFAKEAAEGITQMGGKIEGLESLIEGLAEQAESQRTTTCGSTEIWGTLLQWADWS